ncbi:high mobility group protein [Cinnamomum micranthum f. kanehirae]|uniref:HMG-Y-related protein A n=1 Tax=Cinnamomum micranthum f. kanehirae TaxID=337451 RepID=A0A443NXJ3_9MAGN|nr:high mobility group protein [Cinnamomum micranthum f. kanehirae]
MAAEEVNKPQSLPPYPEMIFAAIDGMKEKDGLNKTSISKYIESTYGDMPAAHSQILAHHLDKMKRSGEIVMIKNNYMRPDPNAPPKRGRGRPPKPKPELPPGAAPASPRPRGRPPKPKDPAEPAAAAMGSPPKPKVGVTSPRKRGRPAGPSSEKKAKVPSGRPRGRPPKARAEVSAVGLD